MATPHTLVHPALSSASQEQAGSEGQASCSHSTKPGCYLLFARWP